MRRVLVILLTLLTVLVVAPVATPAPPEFEPFPCAAFPTGRAYGYEHVRTAAQAGILGHEHKPGFHGGYSQCQP